ncbi:hypothetical protein NDN08_005345 [Rhodosorus marinus]|uniref:ShKT domain-containing protein n=1 Tax=Rhodosorus marinus TaxID=101924 RepID=A0AAV8V1A1_9RHOD|nr:hypothetical protein NDN08_005345 [Rhodosorus marinus]
MKVLARVLFVLLSLAAYSLASPVMKSHFEAVEVAEVARPVVLGLDCLESCIDNCDYMYTKYSSSWFVCKRTCKNLCGSFTTKPDPTHGTDDDGDDDSENFLELA